MAVQIKKQSKFTLKCQQVNVTFTNTRLWSTMRLEAAFSLRSFDPSRSNKPKQSNQTGFKWRKWSIFDRGRARSLFKLAAGQLLKLKCVLISNSSRLSHLTEQTELRVMVPWEPEEIKTRLFTEHSEGNHFPSLHTDSVSFKLSFGILPSWHL